MQEPLADYVDGCDEPMEYVRSGSYTPSPGSPTRPLSPYSQDRAMEFESARTHRKAKNARASKALCGAIIFCFCFMVAEGIGGFIAHSLAVLTDAAHMLTDVAALSLALFAMHMSHRPASEKYSYGWHRAESVGALGSVFTIWALVGAITVSAIQRMVEQVKCASDVNRSDCEGVDAPIMVGIGIGGLAANMCTAGILGWGGQHDEASMHSEEEEYNDKKKKDPKKNLNMRGAFLHALGDCIQSVGVILAGAIIWGYNKHIFGEASDNHSWANLADPCCSILFGIITLYTTVSLFRDLLKILMEGVPTDISYREVNDALWDIPAVDSVHDLHIWSLTAENVVLSVHLIVDHEDKINAPVVLRRAQEVCAKFHIEHTTIQLDSLDINVTRCGTKCFMCAN